MNNRQLRVVIATVLGMACAGPGHAQNLPADCSAATVPSQPVALSVAGKQFTPKSIKLSLAGSVRIGDKELETYSVKFRSEDSFSSPLDASVTVAVEKGKQVDGRTFRKLPTKDLMKQPGPQSGLPEVQGWSMSDDDAKLNQNHVSYLGSLRLEFGKRSGNRIPGKIYLCVAKGQKSSFQKTPTTEDSSAIGTFEAVID